MELAVAELGLEVVERSVNRSELYVSDEVFLCGTAAEITPVYEIDHRTVGDGRAGPVTAAVSDLYAAVVRGKLPPTGAGATRSTRRGDRAMLEIVIQGRGGRGGVTLAKLIAGAYFLRGDYVQAFGVYGAERAGAPVQSFVRVDANEITAHLPIAEPDHVVVIDRR